MTDYKDTLNLPKTELAMKANLPSKEPTMLKHWEDIDLNQKNSFHRCYKFHLILILNQLQDIKLTVMLLL